MFKIQSEVIITLIVEANENEQIEVEASSISNTLDGACGYFW